LKENIIWQGIENGHNIYEFQYRNNIPPGFQSDGKRYIDGPGGMWCVNIGYGREEMADVIRDQVLSMPYCSPWTEANEPAALLAAKLAEISPGDLNRVFMTNSGSTAVDSALRFVMYRNNVMGRPEKKHIISRHSAYHGSTYLSSSAAGKDRDKSFMDTNTEIFHHISDPKPYARPEGMSVESWLEFLVKEFEDKILELGADKVAAFIGEPLLASGGVSIPPKGYHKRFLDQKYWLKERIFEEGVMISPVVISLRRRALRSHLASCGRMVPPARLRSAALTRSSSVGEANRPDFPNSPLTASATRIYGCRAHTATCRGSAMLYSVAPLRSGRPDTSSWYARWR